MLNICGFAHRIAKHSNCTHNRTGYKYAAMWSYFTIKGHCSALTVRPHETYLGSFSSTQQLVEDFQRAASETDRRKTPGTAVHWFDTRLVRSQGRKWLPFGPGGASAVFHVQETNSRAATSTRVRGFTHAEKHIAPKARAIVSDTNRVWGCLGIARHSPDAVRPPRIWSRLLFNPCISASPPFVGVIYTIVYARTNM